MNALTLFGTDSLRPDATSVLLSSLDTPVLAARRLVQLSVLVFLLTACPVRADYAEVKKDFDDYAPATQAVSSPARAAAANSVTATANDEDFKAQTQKLRDEGKKWEAALLSASPEDKFYTPDQATIALLGARGATNPLADGFKLETLEAMALYQNPAALSKERELRAVLTGFTQVENLDTVLRRYSFVTSTLMTGVGNMENPNSAAAKFPFPGVLALKGQIVTQDYLAVREELEIARRQAVTGARKAYWELVYIGRAREITARMLDLMENLKGAVSARYEAGQTSFQDVVRVGIEREKLREELKTLTEERRNMEAMIREVLGLPVTSAIGVPEAREPRTTAPREDELYPLAASRRQEIRRMRAMIGKMERMLLMSESMIYPGFDLGFSDYGRDELAKIGQTPLMGGDTGGFATELPAGIGQGLPKMPWYGKDEGYLKEIRQRIEALKKDLEMEESSTRQNVHRSWFDLDRAIREEALYADRVSALSQTALEASTRGYSAGKVMFADLIETYTGWLASTLSAARARADIGLAWAGLEAAVGTQFKSKEH